MKFNPGDKVVLVKEDRWSKEDELKIGQLYTVKVCRADSIKVEEGRASFWVESKQFKKVVTTVDIGAKVVRGRDWDWGDQDKDSIYGIAEKASEGGWIQVIWYSKEGNKLNTDSYRIGAQGKYDLYYYDGAEEVTPKEDPTPKSELLVFDQYKIGDVVVSLEEVGGLRVIGDMFTVLPESRKAALYYKKIANSSNPSSWRAATEIEAAAFKQGITNIKHIIPEPSSPPQPEKSQTNTIGLEKLSMDGLIREMQKFIPGYYHGCTLEVVSIPPTRGHVKIGSRFISNVNREWLEHAVDQFRKGKPTPGPDPKNTYCANYRPENLKVVFEDTTPVEVSQKPEVITEEMPCKELEGKFVRCLSPSSDYLHDQYYFVTEVTIDGSIRIVDRKEAFLWSNYSSGSKVREIFDLSKGYTYDEVKDKIDYRALQKAADLGFKVPNVLIADYLEPYQSDVSITVEIPTSTKHKSDASFQVAFVETQLRKPGKKQKIKF